MATPEAVTAFLEASSVRAVVLDETSGRYSLDHHTLLERALQASPGEWGSPARYPGDAERSVLVYLNQRNPPRPVRSFRMVRGLDGSDVFELAPEQIGDPQVAGH